MIEAYDVLSQLSQEAGCDVQDNQNVATLRQFVEEANTPRKTEDSVVTSTHTVGQVGHPGDQMDRDAPKCEGLVVTLPDIVPSVAAHRVDLPDIIADSLDSAKTPKISWRPKKTRPKFRISRPMEPPRGRNWSDLTWKQAGARLSQVASRFSSGEQRREDRERASPDSQTDTELLISNVFKCVQALGLLLVMKKINNMLK